MRFEVDHRHLVPLGAVLDVNDKHTAAARGYSFVVHGVLSTPAVAELVVVEWVGSKRVNAEDLYSTGEGCFYRGLRRRYGASSFSIQDTQSSYLTVTHAETGGPIR